MFIAGQEFLRITVGSFGSIGEGGGGGTEGAHLPKPPQSLTKCWKMGLTGLHDSYGRGICSFAVFVSVSRPFCRFTLDYERHFVLSCKEKLEPLIRSCFGIF